MSWCILGAHVVGLLVGGYIGWAITSIRDAKLFRRGTELLFWARGRIAELEAAQQAGEGQEKKP